MSDLLNSLAVCQSILGKNETAESFTKGKGCLMTFNNISKKIVLYNLEYQRDVLLKRFLFEKSQLQPYVSTDSQVKITRYSIIQKTTGTPKLRNLCTR